MGSIDIEGTRGKTVRTLRPKGALTALAAVAVLAALLFGNVTVAHASNISRANAVRAAHEYLQTQAFSLKGLVSQLKFEGFSTSDATYGATHSGANWMKQAVRAAKEYLQTEAFSRRGMIEQLEFDGFTPAQARHGAIAVGLGRSRRGGGSEANSLDRHSPGDAEPRLALRQRKA